MVNFQVPSKYRDLGLPKHMQVKHSLRSAIDRGMFHLGDKLPSIQQMADEYDVSYITMRQAIVALEEEGLIRSIHGRGTFVADILPESVRPGIKRIKVVMPGQPDPSYINGIRKDASNHTTEILGCIGEVMHRDGIEVTLASTINTSLKDIVDEETDGYFMVAPRKRFLPELAELAGNGCRFVVVNSSWPEQRDFVCVDSSNYESARQAVQFVYNLGHRKIGFISNFGLPCDVTNSNDRFLGYRDALDGLGLSYTDDLLVVPEYNPADPGAPNKLYETMLEYLKHADRPTALFAVGLFEAGCIYKAAGSLGIKIPEQLSVVGFDDFESAAFLQPPLTTFRQPLYEMVKAAYHSLIKQAAGDHVAGGNTFIPCTFVKRDSAGPLI